MWAPLATLRNLRRRSRSPARDRRGLRRFQPALTRLEDRTAPATSITAILDKRNLVLFVEGTDNAMGDAIRIVLKDGQYSVEGVNIQLIDNGAITEQATVSEDIVRSIDVFGLGGDDGIGLFDFTAGGGSPRPFFANGGAGNDHIVGGDGQSALHGGPGDDVLEGEGGDDGLLGGDGDDILQGGDGRDMMRGGSGADFLDGGAGNEKMYGDEGSDRLVGGAGDDFLHGGDDADEIDGEEGSDHLLGEEGNDILLGGAGDDRLDGHAGLDLLIGGLGEDQLNGGPSDDILVAGTTDLDADRVALGAIMVEWTRDDLGYDQRVEHLRVGGGHNGAVTLNESTVHDDGAADRLIGGSGRDLFFARWSGDLSDLVTDRFDEIVIELA